MFDWRKGNYDIRPLNIAIGCGRKKCKVTLSLSRHAYFRKFPHSIWKCHSTSFIPAYGEQDDSERRISECSRWGRERPNIGMSYDTLKTKCMIDIRIMPQSEESSIQIAELVDRTISWIPLKLLRERLPTGQHTSTKQERNLMIRKEFFYFAKTKSVQMTTKLIKLCEKDMHSRWW